MTKETLQRAKEIMEEITNVEIYLEKIDILLSITLDIYVTQQVPIPPEYRSTLLNNIRDMYRIKLSELQNIMRML